MARILTDSHGSEPVKWYEQLEPSTMREAQFEQQVLLHANSVYPNYFVFPFKKSVPAKNRHTGDIEQVRPDLAFIARDYQEWWVVELEMGYHSLKGHVLPQVEKLVDADYTDAAEYLAQQIPELSVSDVQRLAYNHATQVLVILNQIKLDWIVPLEELGASVAVFETYRQHDGGEAFRADGAYPSRASEVLSQCCYHPVISGILGIETPENVDLPGNHEILRLSFNNCLTEWTRMDADGRVWLAPRSQSPLKPGRSYQIARLDNGNLVLSESN